MYRNKRNCFHKTTMNLIWGRNFVCSRVNLTLLIFDSCLQAMRPANQTGSNFANSMDRTKIDKKWIQRNRKSWTQSEWNSTLRWNLTNHISHVTFFKLSYLSNPSIDTATLQLVPCSHKSRMPRFATYGCKYLHFLIPVPWSVFHAQTARWP